MANWFWAGPIGQGGERGKEGRSRDRQIIDMGEGAKCQVPSAKCQVPSAKCQAKACSEVGVLRTCTLYSFTLLYKHRLELAIILMCDD